MHCLVHSSSFFEPDDNSGRRARFAVHFFPGMVETILFATCLMMSIDEEDSEFARRMGVLLQEMEAAYDERLDFIQELEAVLGATVAVKTTEFLNDALWKDNRRMEISEDIRLAGEINALCARVTAIVDERETFVDELDILRERSVSSKMGEFMKQSTVNDPTINAINDELGPYSKEFPYTSY
nr:hypothetical protein [Tanacetum cinerariifolium]